MKCIINNYQIKEKYISLNVRVSKKDIAQMTLDELEKSIVLEADIMIDDGIHITREQQKKIYALYNDFSEYTGYTVIETKEYLKELFCIDNRLKKFSVASNKCSLKQANDFITFILEFFIQNGIPLTQDSINATTDITRYMYYCVMTRTCCVTGRKADIHHVDAVGMGRDRTKINQIGMAVLPLCREKHMEIHQIGLSDFLKKYHIVPIKLNPKMINHLNIV